MEFRNCLSDLASTADDEPQDLQSARNEMATKVPTWRLQQRLSQETWRMDYTRYILLELELTNRKI